MLRIAGGRVGLEIFERFIRNKKKFTSILKQKFVDNVHSITSCNVAVLILFN